MASEEELQRLAADELLREAHRGGVRAQVAGALAWLPGTVPNTDKRFLANTLRHTLAANRIRAPRGVLGASSDWSTGHGLTTAGHTHARHQHRTRSRSRDPTRRYDGRTIRCEDQTSCCRDQTNIRGHRTSRCENQTSGCGNHSEAGVSKMQLVEKRERTLNRNETAEDHSGVSSCREGYCGNGRVENRLHVEDDYSGEERRAWDWSRKKKR